MATKTTNTVKFENEPEIMRHSNVVLSEGLLPYRVVLCDLGDKFVTWNERMTVTATERPDGVIELTCRHFAYDNGNYFEFRKMDKQGFSNWPERPVALENAVQDFKERCARVRVA
jgi:hypothetical protein